MAQITGILIKEYTDRNTQAKKKFAEVQLDGKPHSIWSGFETLKLGDTVEGEAQDKGPGKTPTYRIKSVNGVQTSGYAGKGGGRPPSPIESFACAYAKDLAVACVNQGIIKTSVEIDATLEHYFTLFMGKLKT